MGLLWQKLKLHLVRKIKAILYIIFSKYWVVVTQDKIFDTAYYMYNSHILLHRSIKHKVQSEIEEVERQDEALEEAKRIIAEKI